MTTTLPIEYRGGENFNLLDALVEGRKLNLGERVSRFSAFLADQASRQEYLCMRPIASPADREVVVVDPYTGQPRRMLMFGSNNYLGLAHHPHVCARAQQAIADYGVGMAGPPLLNGYTRLHQELEERLSAFKHTEDTLLFPTGYFGEAS